MPQEDRRASRGQRLGERVALHVRAANSMALVEQDVGDGTHPGARDTDDMVMHPYAFRGEFRVIKIIIALLLSTAPSAPICPETRQPPNCKDRQNE